MLAPEQSIALAQPDLPPETATGDPLGVLRVLRARLAQHIAEPQRASHDLVVALFACDEDSQVLLRKLSAGFVQSLANSTDRHALIWPEVEAFLGELFIAYRQCLERAGDLGLALHTELLARLMRVGGNWIKWRHYRYGPFENVIWAVLGVEYLSARNEGRARRPVNLRRGRSTTTHIEREYVRAIALQCASFDQLPISLMDIVDRLIYFVLDYLQISDQPLPGATHCFNPWKAMPPHRVLPSAQSEPGSWYFSARDAFLPFQQIADMLAQDQVPPALESGASALLRVRAGLEHCRTIWSETPPARRFRRHPIHGGLKVVCGLEGLAELLDHADPVQEASPRPVIEWQLQDISKKGLACIAPEQAARDLQVGSVVGLRPTDGSGWQIGVVRRLQRNHDDTVVAGVETLSHKPYVVQVDDGRQRLGVVVCDPLLHGEAVRLIVQRLALRSNVPIFLNWQGELIKLKPLNMGFLGQDYEIRVYQVL